jgi:hypothetical protein
VKEASLTPIAVYFRHPDLSLEAFDEVDRRVHEATGGAEPDGLLHHSVYGTDGDLHTFEIWDSADAFEAFGRLLMPIIAELGVQAGQPFIMPLHRLTQQASTVAASTR